ncbi:MAG: hypothetical protein ABSG64_10835 [Solirubrobacteraceae bacterium]|jgi:hypothetical protein
MRRLGVLTVVLAFYLPAPALAASTSKVELWTALHGNLDCGAAIHAPNKPPSEIICSDPRIPAPKNEGPAYGDPGFVFLASSGRAILARTSQDTFAGTGNPVTLSAGTRWHLGTVNVTCTISAQSVRCVNGAHHGFTITKHSYAAF